LFKIEMLPAGHGDCLYIEYGEEKSPHRVLIDGGPYYAFEPLEKRIKAMIKANLVFDLLVITHVDSDHIDGIVKLIGANPSNLKSPITDVWFNSWNQFAKEPEDKLGPEHGEMLGAVIEKNKLSWNKAFGKEAVANPNHATLESKDLSGGLKITLLSPTKAELIALKPYWVQEVRGAGLEPGSRDQALEKLRKNMRLRPADIMGVKKKIKPINQIFEGKEKFEPEPSPTNASSIAFLAEYNDGTQPKSCVFAGDAHPDVLSASIEKILAQRGEKRLKVDAFKVSHHGSKHNTSPELLRLLDCKKFLVSTSGAGKSQHPDREAIALIIQESKPDTELFFNYLSDQNKCWDNSTLRKRYHYKTHYPPGGEEGLTVLL